MASVSVTLVQASADNMDKLTKSIEHHKEKMIKMKDTLVKERREGIELKRKHKDTLSEK